MELNEFLNKIKDLNVDDMSVPVKVGYKDIKNITLSDETVIIETEKSTLRTMSEHNDEHRKIHNVLDSIYKPKLNGIKCPMCGCELLDLEPGVVYLSIPPKLKVGCSDCDYIGTRIC